MVKKRRLLTVNSTPGKSRTREAVSPQSGEEVLTARDRLKGALQDLLPAHSDEETDSSDDELDRHWHSSRAKRLSALKKKQGDKQNEQRETGSRPFVMKLFDRSVDLAQFNESTPLYPICRAWMANQPHQPYNAVKKKSPAPDPKDDSINYLDDESNLDPVKDVYKLPPPDVSVQGNNKIRIPPPTPYITKYFSMDQDGYDLPKKEQLLQDNLAHWTRVRRSWLDASAKNEARYKTSCKVLLAMLNK